MAVIDFEENYLDKINKGINSLSFQNLRSGIIDSFCNGNKVIFITSFQSLITQLALIVSESLKNPKLLYGSYYNQAINYLTKDVIGDESLYNYLVASKINENGNIVKHSLDDLKDIDMETIVYIFNKLLSFLDQRLSCNLFSSLLIEANSKKPEVIEEKKSLFDIASSSSIFSNDNSIKYFTLGEDKVNIRIEKQCTVDIYTRRVNAVVDLNIVSGNLNDKIKIELLNNHKESVKSIMTEINTLPFNAKYDIIIDEASLNGNSLTIGVNASLVSIIKEKREEKYRVPYQNGRTTSYRQSYRLVEYDVEKTIASEEFFITQELVLRK